MSMLIHRLKLSGLLSFGPAGIDLPMEPLTVLIGPNGSGKSNLLEAISLLQAAPRGISEPISRMGGIREWLWKGPEAPDSIALENTADFPQGYRLRHSVTLTDEGGRPVVVAEQIEPSTKSPRGPYGYCYYRPPQGDEQAMLADAARAMAEARGPESLKSKDMNFTPSMITDSTRGIVEFFSTFDRGNSLLSSFAIPDYPALWYLKRQYEGIRLS